MVFKGVQKRLGIRVIRYLDVIGIGVPSACDGAKFDVWRSLIGFWGMKTRLRQRKRCVSIVG